MKVLVTGVKGQLGFDVFNELVSRGFETFGVDIDEMDITSYEDVNRVINEIKVECVVHCAAYTAVDIAEDDVDLCRKVNVDGSKNIALVCKNLDIKMVYISTDYVFSGEGTEAFEVDSPKRPNNVYGLSKSDGEDIVTELVYKHFIIRISWAFGINGNNFINTMLRLGKERGEVKVVNDQIGSPTYTYDLAKLIVDMITTEKYGIYHATNEGYCSWYEFAKEIFKLANLNVSVIPVDSSEFPVKALRPKNSRLSKSSLDQAEFTRLRSWDEALKDYLNRK